MDRASLETLLNRGLSLAEIGRRLGRHESTVAHWMEKHGLEAVHRDRHRARGPLGRDQLEQMVASGASIAEIAARVGRSKTTVRHWLRQYGLKTKNAPGRRITPEVEAAKSAGLAATQIACPRHGETDFVLDGRGYYRCRRCRARSVARRRRRVKEILVEEAGGACRLCGYDRSMRALHFHHLDPSSKRIEINARGTGIAIEKLRAEAKKCILLCANCHAEIEAGIATLPELGEPRVQSWAPRSELDPG